MSTTDDAAETRTDIEGRLLGGSTYRSLGEQQLSPAEERFEQTRAGAKAPWGEIVERNFDSDAPSESPAPTKPTT